MSERNYTDLCFICSADIEKCENCGYRKAEELNKDNGEKVCGDCIYFKLTSYPFIGKGECTSEESPYSRAWDDSCPCEAFEADMRGGTE